MYARFFSLKYPKDAKKLLNEFIEVDSGRSNYSDCLMIFLFLFFSFAEQGLN